MKKLILVMVLCVLSFSALAAEDIDLGKFPLGEWLDPEWDALWKFSTDNIELYTVDGELVFDFRDKIKDFDLKVTTEGVEMSFSCDESERAYKFISALMNTDIKMVIDKANGIHYEVLMKRQ